MSLDLLMQTVVASLTTEQRAALLTAIIPPSLQDALITAHLWRFSCTVSMNFKDGVILSRDYKDHQGYGERNGEGPSKEKR